MRITLDTNIQPELMRAYRTHLRQAMQLITLTEVPSICRDPDDDKVIATAIQGNVDLLLTEDGDLLTPEIIEHLARQGIVVLATKEFLAHLDQEGL